MKYRDDIAELLPEGGIGIELGVAEGRYSERILRRSKLDYLYSVDMWAGDRGHDINQYRTAIKVLEPHKKRNSILKMRFDEALVLFEDNTFDFIYVDGYAHTGEENGQTFKDWWPKLKPGGLIAGDDYHHHWPAVIEQVNLFVAREGLDLNVINCEPLDDWASKYPTWFAYKPKL